MILSHLRFLVSNNIKRLLYQANNISIILRQTCTRLIINVFSPNISNYTLI
uniref:Uncharacterized protein n=1 Tax=Tetranychus urticae TaxID=32264 RepID=T1KFH6_TETUR